MIRAIIPEWPATRTGKLIFTSTNRALEAALEYFDTPEFIFYLEKETKRLKAVCKNMMESKRLNLDNACKLATRMQLNNEALAESYAHRKAMNAFEKWEVIRNDVCTRG